MRFNIGKAWWFIFGSLLVAIIGLTLLIVDAIFHMGKGVSIAGQVIAIVGCFGFAVSFMFK